MCLTFWLFFSILRIRHKTTINPRLFIGSPTKQMKLSEFTKEDLMPEGRKENKNALRSKRMIREAFLQLIQEKELSKVTVTDIINKADINRSTFYAHYPDIYGVIESFEDDVIEKMLTILSEFKYRNFFQNPLPLLLRINRYLEEDMDLYRILITQTGSSSVFRKMSRAFIDYMEKDSDVPEKIKGSAAFEIRIRFFASGILGLYENWFLGNIPGELNDISLEVAKIIKESSSEFLLA